jgi:hypothetical protein
MQTSIDTADGPIRDAALLRHLKSHSASVCVTEVARLLRGIQCQIFNMERSHTSGSVMIDKADSMLVDGEWYAHRTWSTGKAYVHLSSSF